MLFLYRTHVILRNTIVIMAFFFAFLAQSQTTWHIAITGSDSTGDGSMANPYKTLQFTVNQISAGDTVLVHEGVYHNSDFNDGDIWGGNNLLTINNLNGDPSSITTIQPYQEDEVVLEFDSSYGVLIKNSSYITFSGFKVKAIGNQITQAEADAAWGLYKDANGQVHDLAVEMGIDINDPAIQGQSINKPVQTNITKPSYYNGRGIVANKSHHITISDNKLYHITSSAIRVQQSDYVTVEKNEVYFNTYWSTQGVGAITVAESKVRPTNDTFTGVKIKLLKNYVHQNENRMVSWNPSKTFVKFVIDEGTGLFLTRNADTYDHGYILIANNISSYNGASGVVCHKTDRAIIVHNTVYKNGTTNESAAGGIGLNTADNVTVVNNISYAEPDHWALGILANPVTNTIINDNILYNENGSESIHKNIPNGWIEANPLFENQNSDNFNLTADSPAIDTGDTNLDITEDFYGNPRDNFPDIGAIEYDSNLSNNDVTNFNNIGIYPNPTSLGWYINSNETMVAIKIFEASGKRIKSKKINSKTYYISAEPYKTGVYFVKIITQKSTVTTKLIKH